MLMSTTAGDYNQHNPYLAPLSLNQPLSDAASGKEVRQYVFDLGCSGITYLAGDSLGVWPQNSPQYVAEILALMKATGNERLAYNGRELPLRQWLTEHCEIARPHKAQLQFIAERSGNPQLQQLLAQDSATLAGWLYGRQLADILREFPCRASPEQWLAQCKPLQPRRYSIASSPVCFPTQVHLTVAQVRYLSPGLHERYGVATHFLAEQATQAPIFVLPNRNFRLPEAGDTPIIMLAAGIGIAPFRAFLQERNALGHSGKNWLFFGGQHQAHHFYYREELQRWLQRGVLTHLHLAFSRDQARKIYIQERLLEQAAEVWAWLQEGAQLYVCGAMAMGRAIEQTLLQIAEQQGQQSPAQAQDFIRGLIKEKRYLRDVY